MHTYMTRALFVFALALAGIAPAGVAVAHGGAGMTFSSTTQDGYFIDVDYSETAIVAGTAGSFGFNLFTNEARIEPVPFSDSWVRIVKMEDGEVSRTVFAGPIARLNYGPTGFLYEFGEGGTYVLGVSYYRESKDALGERIAEAQFDFVVLDAETGAMLDKKFWYWALVIIFAAVALAVFFKPKKSA